MQKTTKSSEVIRPPKPIFASDGIPSKSDLTMVLSLTVQNSLTLPRNGDSSIAQVVLEFHKQMKLMKLRDKLEPLRIF